MNNMNKISTVPPHGARTAKPGEYPVNPVKRRSLRVFRVFRGSPNPGFPNRFNALLQVALPPIQRIGYHTLSNLYVNKLPFSNCPVHFAHSS
jgi:hypothetical protein